MSNLTEPYFNFRWYQNGFFGSIDYLPIPGTVKPNFDGNKSYTISNPIIPRLPYFPNRQQDCICGAEVINFSQNCHFSPILLELTALVQRSQFHEFRLDPQIESRTIINFVMSTTRSEDIRI